MRRKNHNLKFIAVTLFALMIYHALNPIALDTMKTNSVIPDEEFITIKPASFNSINSPENITYIDPMTGYYPATYGFEDAAPGTLPDYCIHGVGGSFPDTVHSYTTIRDSLTDLAGNTHYNVLELYDHSGSGSATSNVNFLSQGSEAARNCTIEFYATLHTDAAFLYHDYIGIVGDFGNIAMFEWEAWGTLNPPEIRYTNSSGEFLTGVTQAWDQWYRYSIDISCDGGYAGLGVNQFRFRIYDETDALIFTSPDMDMVSNHPTGGPFTLLMVTTESQSLNYMYLDAGPRNTSYFIISMQSSS